MKTTLITRCLMVAGLASSLPVAHAAGTWFEARNDAMGGTGVASSKYGAAPLLNPALLAKSGPSDDLSIILPVVGAQVSDPDNLQDGFDDQVATPNQSTYCRVISCAIIWRAASGKVSHRTALSPDCVQIRSICLTVSGLSTASFCSNSSQCWKARLEAIAGPVPCETNPG